MPRLPFVAALLLAAVSVLRGAESSPILGMEKRIVGGDFMPENEAPYVVTVNMWKPGSSGPVTCGGTLISDRHVVTAAHCLTNVKDMFKSSYTVEVGYNSPHRDKQTKVKATKVDIHPRYIIDNKTDDKYDIAVLTFPTITFGAGVQHIPVDSGQLEPHQPLLAVGWGTTEEGNGMTNSLKRANIKVGEPSACKGAIGGFDDSNEQQVCAQKSLTPGKNICSGDSGSGVFINRNGKQYLLGIASLGINGGGETCDGANAISVFVHVISHLDFVVESSALTREYLLDKKANDKGDDQSQPGNKCDDSPPPAN